MEGPAAQSVALQRGMLEATGVALGALASWEAAGIRAAIEGAAVEAVGEGVTSLDEILRVTRT